MDEEKKEIEDKNELEKIQESEEIPVEPKELLIEEAAVEEEPEKLKSEQIEEEKNIINQNLEKIKTLPILKNPEEAYKRSRLFDKFDTNGNSYLSFSEIEGGVRDILKFNEKLLKRDVIKKAFKSAKSSGVKRSKLSDDYVEKNEFRTFLVYILQYSEYYEMFDLIDLQDDKKINYDEFLKAIPIIKKWGIEIDDPKTAFDSIDSNDGDQIMFDEFCYWAISKNLDLENDDNFDDEELAKLANNNE